MYQIHSSVEATGDGGIVTVLGGSIHHPYATPIPHTSMHFPIANETNCRILKEIISGSHLSNSSQGYGDTVQGSPLPKQISLCRIFKNTKYKKKYLKQTLLRDMGTHCRFAPCHRKSPTFLLISTQPLFSCLHFPHNFKFYFFL